MCDEGAPTPALLERIKGDMKSAMKEKNQVGWGDAMWISTWLQACKLQGPVQKSMESF